MDAQLKKGLLENCVLACLVREDSYGYKILQVIGDFFEISESTLYPILKRLEQSGALSTYSCEYNGRIRKYFKLTDEGRNKLQEFAEAWEEIKKLSDFIIREGMISDDPS